METLDSDMACKFGIVVLPHTYYKFTNTIDGLKNFQYEFLFQLSRHIHN